MSDKVVNDISKKVLGKTVKDIIQDRLVLEIKREIASGIKTFKELAFHLGFNEPSILLVSSNRRQDLHLRNIGRISTRCWKVDTDGYLLLGIPRGKRNTYLLVNAGQERKSVSQLPICVSIIS